MDRRGFIKSGGLILAGTAVGDLGMALAAPALHLNNKFRIGAYAPSHCAAPIFYAQHKDYFKDEGIKVEVINYPSILHIAKDIIAGKLDMGQFVMSLNLAINAGVAPVKTDVPLLIPMILGVHGSSLMVVKDSGIKEPADFRGKRMASNSKVAIHYLLSRYFLKQNGIDIGTDIDLRVAQIKGFNSLINENKIDAFMMPEPVNALAEETGRVSVFMLNKYIWKYHPCCSLNIKQTLFERDRPRVAAAVSAVTRASLYINRASSRQEMVHVLRENSDGYRQVPQSVLERAFSYERSNWIPFPYESSAIFIMNMMQDFGILPKIDAQEHAKRLMQPDFMRLCMERIGAHPPKHNSRPETVLGKTVIL